MDMLIVSPCSMLCDERHHASIPRKKPNTHEFVDGCRRWHYRGNRAGRCLIKDN